MSVFKAHIVAELDTSKVEQQIQNLDNKKIKISVDSNLTKETEKNVKSVDNAIKQTTKSTKTFGQRLKNAFNICSVAALAYKGINLIRQAANSAVNSVKELNQSLTNLRIVTNASQTEAENYMNTYNEMAQSLGATTSEVTNSATDWLRQGKSISETNQLIQDSMKLSKIGMIDSADATTYLTSTLNGYKLEANQATDVVDKLAKLDSSAAITAGGLAEAMSKTAVSADSTGVSMDRLLGYLSAVGEVTQEDMSIIGNAFKTFFARYTAIKSGKLELIDEDGTTEVLSDVEQSLKNVGIDMRSTITEFDNAGDVLDNLYKKWDTLNGTQQNAIANAFGGVRQKERFLGLMENYDKAKKYMDLSANSAGAAEEKFSAYLDGIEAKTKRLQAAFESLSNNTISADTIANITDATTTLVTFVDKSNLLDGAITGTFAGGAIKAFTLLKSGVTNTVMKLNEFHSALNLIKSGNIGEAEIAQLAQMTSNLSNSQLKTVISSKELTTQQRISILTSQGLSKAEAEAKLSAMGLATSENAAASATSTLGGTLKGLWATIKANPLILIVSGISAAVMAFNSYKESVEKAQQATIDAAKESKEHIEALESSLKSYLDLDTSASESDKANAIKAVTEQLNNKTEALKKATEAEKGYTDEVKNSVLADYREAAGKAKNAAVTAQEKIAGQWDADYNSKITIDVKNNQDNESVYDLIKNILGEYVELDTYYAKDYTERAYYIGDSRKKSKIDTKDIDSLLQYYELLKKAQAEVQQKALELGKQGNDLLESPLYKGISKIVDSETNKNNIDEYITYRTEEIFDYTIADNGIPETIDDFNKLKAIMLEEAGNSDILTDAITDRLTTAFSGLANEATKAENKVSNLDFTVDTETLSKQLETQREEISNIADSYKKVSDIIDEYNRTGNLTLDNLETLLSVGDEYIGTLFDENGQLSLNKESYVKLAKAKLEDIRYLMLENAISSLNQLNKGDETTANNELAESTGNLTEQTLKLVAARKLDEGVDPSAIKDVCQTYYQYCAIIDNVEAGLENNADATLGATDATNAQKEALEADKSALEAQKTALEKAKQEQEDYKKSLEDNKSSLEDLIKLTEDYIKQTKEDEKDALEESKKNISERIDKEIELLEAEKERHDQEKKMAESASNLAKANLNMQIAGLDNSATGKQNYKKAKDEYDNTLSDYSESAYERSYELKKQALENYKENEEQRYDELIEKIDEYLSNEVKLYRDACEMVDGDSQALYNNLLSYIHTYTTQTDSEFNHMWNNAQSALSKYNDLHLSTFSLMDYLQGTIYNTEIVISGYETQISDVGTAIDNVGSAIDAVSDSVNNNAAAISNWNNAYQQQKSLIAKSAYNGYVDYNGKRYYTTVDPSRNQTTAISDLMAQIRNDTGSSVDFNTIKNNIKKYAKGTKSAKGGLSIVDEEGINTELIPNKVGNGRYTILPEGNPVFSKAMTNELFDFSSNPDSYFSHFLQGNSELRNITHNYPSDLASKVWDKLKSDSPSVKVSNNRSVSPTIQINIQGDATQSTVKALQKETDNIVQKVMKQTLSIVDKNKNYAKW